ncbi:hypothetical protein EIP91_002849 [Steccherinum ochraceum]|uniref:Uncharacterized protein n=1 Tax=Steccherinum ochraceum TaxID=92696 RepID=A0A4V2MW83_9APHY|nr:hypothetical protein EIP91_002849 [Steccherinum ochraceum]
MSFSEIRKHALDMPAYRDNHPPSAKSKLRVAEQVELESEAIEVIDVRDALEECLPVSFDGKGAYSTTFSYKRANGVTVNPALQIKGLGNVGLPLSERDAKEIKNHARRVSADSGESKSLADLWELSPELLEFANPKWNRILLELAYEMCLSLGVSGVVRKPSCKLTNLLLYGSGSLSKPQTDDSANGAFATVMMFLPSEYTGGELHLTHAATGLSTIYDCSLSNRYETNVVAWYNGITYKTNPVTSGHKLALVYSISYPETSKTRTAPDATKALNRVCNTVQRLRQVLTYWQDHDHLLVGADNDKEEAGTSETGASSRSPSPDPGAVPDKVVLLLSNTYPLADLRLSSLVSEDLQKVSILSSLTRELNDEVHLGLASVVYKIVGSANDDDFDGDEEEYNFEGGCGPPSGGEDLEFSEVSWVNAEVTAMVDLKGNTIGYKKLESLWEAVPGQDVLDDELQKEKWVKQDFTEYLEDGRWALERFYQRTALVIWPHTSNNRIRYGISADAACKALSSLVIDATSAQPSDEARETAHYALQLATRKSAELVASAVCRAAYDWDDAALWSRAVKECCQLGAGLSIFKETIEIREAIMKFGFTKIQEGLDIMLEHDTRNFARFTFLEQVEGWCTNPEGPFHNEAATIVPWIGHSRDASLASLRAPAAEDQDLFIRLSAKYGGLIYLRDRILPQIKKSSEHGFLRDLALRLCKEEIFAGEAALRHEVALAVMRAAIDRAPLGSFTIPAASVHHGYATRKSSVNLEQGKFQCARSYLDACLGNLDCLVVPVLEKLIEVEPLEAQVGARHITDVMIPVLQHLAEYPQTHPHVTVSVETAEFFEWALAPAVQLAGWSPTYAEIQRHVRSTIVAACLPGAAEILFEHLQSPEAAMSATTARVFIEELTSATGPSSRLNLPDGYTGPTSSTVQRTVMQRYIRDVKLSTTRGIVSAIKFCVQWRTLYPDTISAVLQRLTAPTVLIPQYISSVLVPAIPDLRALALQHGLLDAFAPTLQAIIFQWMQNCFLSKPVQDVCERIPSVLAALCKCEKCNWLHNFLVVDTQQPVLTLAGIGAPAKRHLEAELERCASGKGLCSWALYKNRGLTQGIQASPYIGPY